MSSTVLPSLSSKELISGTPAHEQFWRKQFVQCQQSGLSRKRYCRDHQIVYSQYQYWYQKLVNKKTKSKPQKATSPSLLPVTVSRTKVCSPSPGLSTCRFRLSSGHEIMVEQTATAVMLLKELLACS